MANPATLADVLRQTGYSQDGTLAAPTTESPMTKALSEHIKTLPQQLATNQAALDSAIGSWNKTDFATGKPNPNYRPEAIAELTQLMPNMAGMMIGPSSALWNSENAFNAAKMLKQGASPEEVWKATGTAKGLENAFRQEISDAGSHIKGMGNFGEIYEKRKAAYGVDVPTVEEVMYHHPLFEAYPELKGIQVRLLPENSRNNAVFSPTEGVISINPKATSEQARSSMLHELQHAIQETEGWNRGADAGKFLKKYQEQADELEERLIQANRDLKLHAGGKYYDDLLKERDEIAKEYRDFMGADHQGVIRKATQEYKAHGGEAEARLTQTRRDLTDEKRKEVYPFAKGDMALDINPEDAIIKLKNDSHTITRKQLLQQLLETKK